MKEEILLKAIVLNSIDYKEKDKQITLFSLENGKLTAVLKGCKAPNAKLKFAFSPFCFAEFKLVLNGNYYTIIDATLIDSFFDLTKDIGSYYVGMTMLEIVNHISKFNEENSRLFVELLTVLKNLCYTDANSKKLLSKFVLNVLELIGYKLTFKECYRCDMPFINEKFLSLSSGEFVCNNCRSEDCIKISNVAFNTLKNISNTEYERLNTLKIDNQVLNECYSVLLENIECRIERKLNSKNMLKTLM